MRTCKLLILFFLLANNAVAQTTKQFNIFSYTLPAGFIIKEKTNRLLLEIKEGNSFCQLHLWPAQQGSSDPEANFKTDWDHFAGKQYKIGDPTQKQTETQNGWTVVNGAGVATIEGVQFIITVSTFTQNDISWCVITLFNDEKYMTTIDNYLQSINPDIKKFVRKADPPVNNNITTVNNQPVSNGYQFTTTNFDDGWVSIPKEDWVQTTKGNIKVLIHYPNKKADEYNPDGDAALKNAWNTLVAPRYSNATGMFFKSGYTFETTPNYAAAQMTDNATGKRVYVVFYQRTYYGNNNKYVEIIAPDQTAFEQVFGNYENNKANKTWNALNSLQDYNKFAVAPSDLKGTWTTDFGAAISYVYVATGLSAGMDTHSSAESFEFTGNGNYKWELNVASGQVGSIKFQQAKTSGTVTMPDNWHIQFSDIFGKPKRYEAMFTCIKGLRILWLDGKPYAKK
ncbi:MAG: hypothetical protein JNM88_07645 [Chitinophagaceae bacterium]|nr:hypothetical protein [Chitinophagaceae bacterium]